MSKTVSELFWKNRNELYTLVEKDINFRLPSLANAQETPMRLAHLE